MKAVLGFLGGSGVYDLPGLSDPEWCDVASPWGEQSDAILHATIGGLPVRFLPRHGGGHRLSPSHIGLPRQHRRADARRRHRSCLRLRALDGAIVTAPDKRDPALMASDAVAGRVLGAGN